ncbi:hypothetical protein GCM10009849_13100 [Sinomonas flava]|uniref:Uncharacterized protein n=1 Tax=Sinomonas flava TaxID=496857 RepID=A0ABN3BQD3_9MICC
MKSSGILAARTSTAEAPGAVGSRSGSGVGDWSAGSMGPIILSECRESKIAFPAPRPPSGGRASLSRAPDWHAAQISGRLDELFKRSFVSRSG